MGGKGGVSLTGATEVLRHRNLHGLRSAEELKLNLGAESV